MRRRAKADANQQQIVRELRALGMSVRHTHTIGQGFPDLAVGWRGVTLLVELKVDGGRLSADEAEFFKAWRGAAIVARTSGVRLRQQTKKGETNMKKNLIVTRHKTLVEWLRRHGIEGEVIEQATPEDVRGKDVFGILPLWLAAEANSVTEVSMPNLPLEARKRVNGGDFTLEEMDEWGAHLETFVVLGGKTADWLKRNGKDKVETGLYFL